MNTFRFLRIKHLILILPTLIVIAGVYAFAAANTVPETGAGDGSNTISGYTISNVDYNANGDSDPSDIETVGFDVTPDGGQGAPTEVYAKIVATETTWITCTNPITTNWSCSFTPNVATADADELNVIAFE